MSSVEYMEEGGEDGDMDRERSRRVQSAEREDWARWEPSDSCCAICTTSFASSERVARPVGCTHVFCLACLQKWCREENSCPLCKLKFRSMSVGVVQQKLGTVDFETTLPVEDRKLRVPEDVDSWESDSSDEHSWLCDVCSTVVPRSDAISCESCMCNVVHEHCAVDAEHGWTCEDCEPVSVTRRLLRSSRRRTRSAFEGAGREVDGDPGPVRRRRVFSASEDFIQQMILFRRRLGLPGDDDEEEEDPEDPEDCDDHIFVVEDEEESERAHHACSDSSNDCERYLVAESSSSTEKDGEEDEWPCAAATGSTMQQELWSYPRQFLSSVQSAPQSTEVRDGDTDRDKQSLPSREAVDASAREGATSDVTAETSGTPPSISATSSGITTTTAFPLRTRLRRSLASLFINHPA